MKAGIESRPEEGSSPERIRFQAAHRKVLMAVAGIRYYRRPFELI